MPQIIYLAQQIEGINGWYTNRLIVRDVTYGPRQVVSGCASIPREKLDPTWTDFHEPDDKEDDNAASARQES